MSDPQSVLYPQSPEFISSRGLFAAPRFSSLYDQEIKVIKEFKAASAVPLIILLPFARNVQELLIGKRLLAAAGLSRSVSLKIYASIDTPHLLQSTSSLSEIGIDGVSINLNHLLPLWLGLSPEAPEFQDSLFQFIPSLSTMIRNSCVSFSSLGLNSHIRGFALIKNTDYLDMAVNCGIQSVSLPLSDWSHAAAAIKLAEERRVLP
jgi:hypothetical protein